MSRTIACLSQDCPGGNQENRREPEQDTRHPSGRTGSGNNNRRFLTKYQTAGLTKRIAEDENGKRRSHQGVFSGYSHPFNPEPVCATPPCGISQSLTNLQLVL